MINIYIQKNGYFVKCTSHGNLTMWTVSIIRWPGNQITWLEWLTFVSTQSCTITTSTKAVVFPDRLWLVYFGQSEPTGNYVKSGMLPLSTSYVFFGRIYILTRLPILGIQGEMHQYMRSVSKLEEFILNLSIVPMYTFVPTMWLVTLYKAPASI